MEFQSAMSHNHSRSRIGAETAITSLRPKEAVGGIFCQLFMIIFLEAVLQPSCGDDSLDSVTDLMHCANRRS